MSFFETHKRRRSGSIDDSVFKKPKYDAYGYDEDGYNEDGMDRYHFDRDGFTETEDGFIIDREGYDKRGYNLKGYDREGLWDDSRAPETDDEEEEEEEEEEEPGKGIDGRKIYNEDGTRNTKKELTSNPRIEMLYKDLTNIDNISDSQICLGHAFAVLWGGRASANTTRITTSEIGSLSVYDHILSIFSGQTKITKEFLFFSGENVNQHNTLISFYTPEIDSEWKKTYIWYYNPEGTNKEVFYKEPQKIFISTVGSMVKELYKDHGMERRTDLSTDSIEVITGYDLFDSRVVDEYLQEDFLNAKDYKRIRWAYAYNKLLLLSPIHVVEEYNRVSTGRNKHNIPIEVMILLKIIFRRDSVEMIPWKDSNASEGIQELTKDSLGGCHLDIIERKAIANSHSVGACVVWSTLYSKLVQVSLNGIHDREDVIELITDFIPKVSLMGERNATALLGKAVVMENFGKETFRFMDMFYGKLPPSFQTPDEKRVFQKKVVGEYDKAMKAIKSDPVSLYKPLSHPFRPGRESKRVGILLDFMKSVASENISEDEEVVIRRNIIRGGYMTSSTWDLLLNIIMMVISCRYKSLRD